MTSPDASTRVVSTGKMTSRGPVPDEFTIKGSTPSGKPRVFVCNVCTRAFARLEHLKRHQRSHTKEKPFTCSICARKFSRRDLLLRHSAKLHAGAANSTPRLRKKSLKFENIHDNLNNNHIVDSFNNNNNNNININNNNNNINHNQDIQDSNSNSNSVVRDELNNFNLLTHSVLKPDINSIILPNNSRRASFSAMSGNNYALGNTEMVYASDAIEFASPQPDDTEQERWLNDNADNNLNININQNVDHQIFQTEIQQLNTFLRNSNSQSKVAKGYSFYDDGYPTTSSALSSNTLKSLLENLSQSTDPNAINHQNHQNNDISNKVNSWQQSLFNIEPGASNSYGLPQGYSFYGTGSTDLDRTSSSSNSANILGSYHDQLSSQATISPVLMEPVPIDQAYSSDSFRRSSDTDNTNENININNNNNHNNNIHPLFPTSRLSSYSQAYLFTPNMTHMVKKSLAEYPFFGTQTPDLPSLDNLNHYVDQFAAKFLTHHPFIHKSLLNEHAIIKDALNNNTITTDNTFMQNFTVSIVCLPLLIACIGAVFSNKASDAASLYEISRRCIHVYLETRKRLTPSQNQSQSQSHSQSQISPSSPSSPTPPPTPLWLIQSLTLSIIYGLFADEEISTDVTIRQLHALNSLVKSSSLCRLPSNPQIAIFKDFIAYESMIRTVHMIFHVSALLTMLYNIEPSIHISDMDIDLPISTLLWDCATEEEYRRMTENFDFRSVNFIHVLQRFVNGDNCEDLHLTELGLLAVVNGLHQLTYYTQFNELSPLPSTLCVPVEQLRHVANNWLIFLQNSESDNEPSEVLNDCLMLSHYLNLKLNNNVNLNSVKQHMWLKSFQDVNETYMNSMKEQEDLTAALNTSLAILNLVFFNKDTSLIGTISPVHKLENETLQKLDKIYDVHDYNTINLNILHRLSIDSQLLVDVFLVLVKFLVNFENEFKSNARFSSLTNFTYLQSSLFDDVTNDNSTTGKMFKYYYTLFKIYLNLEAFVKHNYNLVDFETGQGYAVLSQLNDLNDTDHIVAEMLTVKVPHKILKLAGLLFAAVHERNYTLSAFRNCSNVLFHLRVYLETREDYV